MPDVLAEICARKRAVVTERRARLPLAELEARLPEAPTPRGFARALAQAAAAGRPALIAEIKKASPSRGLIRPRFEPAALARAYAEGGATCLSVLTDEAYFQGRDDDLRTARAAVELPVLRKDFTLEPYQVVEARCLGADCILLIMAALEDGRARDLAQQADALGMDVLVEVHDRAELERAIPLGTSLIGINNRDLKTLRTDLQTTIDLAPLVPDDRLLVAESGLGSFDDLERMAAIGARAFLVGESLMRQDDVAAATRALLGLEAAAWAV